MKKGLIFIAFTMSCFIALSFASTINATTMYGTVSDCTNDNTLHNDVEPSYVISNNDQEEVTITYNSAILKLLPADDSDDVNRPADYAWLGIKVTAPEGASKYSVQCNDGEIEDKGNIVDNCVIDYFGVNADKLKTATTTGNGLLYTYKIYWKDADGNETTQTIKIVINPAKFEVYDLNNSDVKWNEEIYNQEVKKVQDAKKAAEQNTPKKEDKKDTTPQTGVVDYSVYMAIATAVVALGGIFTVKKLVR